jgi:hypothetical protein
VVWHNQFNIFYHVVVDGLMEITSTEVDGATHLYPRLSTGRKNQVACLKLFQEDACCGIAH